MANKNDKERKDKDDQDNVVSFADAHWQKQHDIKEEKVETLAKRFEAAMPSKATPVKDYLKKKRNKKKPKK